MTLTERGGADAHRADAGGSGLTESACAALGATAPGSGGSVLSEHLWRLLCSHRLRSIDAGLLDSVRTLDDLDHVSGVREANGTADRDFGPRTAGHGSDGRSPGRLVLADLRPSELGLLYESAVSSERALHWRFRGSTPGPAAFRDLIFDGVQIHKVLRTRTDDRPAVYCVVYNYDAFLGTACFGYHLVGETDGSLYALEGAIQFLAHVLDVLPLRHVYFEVPEFTVGHLGSSTFEPLVVRGVFPDRYFFRGRWWPQHVLSIDRADLSGIVDAWTAVVDFDRAVTTPAESTPNSPLPTSP